MYLSRGSTVITDRTEEKLFKMAVSADSDTRGMRILQPEVTRPDLNTRDSLNAIFDRFWARLQARTQSAASKQTPLTDQACSTGRPGIPLKGITLYLTLAPRTRRLPGLRALRVQTHRYRPHKRRAAKKTRQHTPDPQKARRTTPTGESLNPIGVQARGQTVPALTQLQGRRGTPPSRRCIDSKRAARRQPQLDLPQRRTQKKSGFSRDGMALPSRGIG
ncbi:Hypothetical predicted protein [Pelobates cultripes]|uniref:Uncharacterized protein n=1 Tax=Pelobates cultripes TaxID=61616 RepID=A0AAD1VU35_PELCU|nr:Hypothetical predicted protein [Pelobates cultripes]